VQTKRLEKAGVLQYFVRLFVSQTIGYEKPDIRFFEHCLRETGYGPHEVLMIGDSVAADIKGGLNAGWNVCYLNRHGKPAGVDCTEIKHLKELHTIIT
jgi:2-haloacid dehalogenase